MDHYSGPSAKILLNGSRAYAATYSRHLASYRSLVDKRCLDFIHCCRADIV